MFLLQGRHQQLIHRANDKVGQKRLFASLKPLVHHHPFLRVVGIILHRHRLLLQFQIVCIQLRHAVRQPDGVFQPVRLFLRPVQQPPKNTVGGGLGRQTKEDAALPAALCQNLRRCQRGLGEQLPGEAGERERGGTENNKNGYKQSWDRPAVCP